MDTVPIQHSEERSMSSLVTPILANQLEEVMTDMEELRRDPNHSSVAMVAMIMRNKILEEAGQVVVAQANQASLDRDLRSVED